MYAQPLTADDTDRLKEVFASFEEVTAVYAFGSRVEGRARADSDLDLGVVSGSAEPARLKLDLLAALVEAGFESVDLVLLEGADPVVRYEAVRPNRLVYSRPSFEHPTFYSRCVREYLDLLPTLEVQRRAYKQRLGGPTRRTDPAASSAG